MVLNPIHTSSRLLIHICPAYDPPIPSHMNIESCSTRTTARPTTHVDAINSSHPRTMSQAATVLHTPELIELILNELACERLTKDLARCARINRLWNHEATRILWSIWDSYQVGHSRLLHRRLQSWHKKGMLSHIQPSRQQQYANLVREIVLRYDMKGSLAQDEELALMSSLKFPKAQQLHAIGLCESKGPADRDVAIDALSAIMSSSHLVKIAINNGASRFDDSVEFFLDHLPWSSCNFLQSFLFTGTTRYRCLIRVLRQVPLLKNLHIAIVSNQYDSRFTDLLTTIWTMKHLASLSLDFRVHPSNTRYDNSAARWRMLQEDDLFSGAIPTSTGVLQSLRKLSLAFRPQFLAKILDSVSGLGIEEMELHPRVFLQHDENSIIESGFFPEKPIHSVRRLHIKQHWATDSRAPDPWETFPYRWAIGLRDKFPQLESIRWTDQKETPLKLHFDSDTLSILKDVAPINGEPATGQQGDLGQ